MERARLTELLKDPGSTDRSDMAALRSMAERFPWFGGARLLQAVGGHNVDDLLANDGKGVPGAVLPSRAVLFDLVHKHEAVPAPMPSVAPAAMVTTEPPQVPTVAPVTEVAALPHPLPAAPPPPPLPETGLALPQPGPEPKSAAPDHVDPAAQAAPPATDGTPAQEAPETTEAQMQPASSIPPATGADEELGRMYAEALHASVYDLSAWETPAPAPPPAPAPSPYQLPEPVAAVGKKPASGHTRRSFTDWLDSAGKEDTTLNFPSTSAAAAPLRAETLDQRQIMDRFIQQETPPPPKQRAEFFKPQSTAKRSLQDAGLVSETLARIHEKQGNFAKAIEVYDRLAVKHPEKSVYFAALSEALRARSNK